MDMVFNIVSEIGSMVTSGWLCCLLGWELWHGGIIFTDFSSAAVTMSFFVIFMYSVRNCVRAALRAINVVENVYFPIPMIIAATTVLALRFFPFRENVCAPYSVLLCAVGCASGILGVLAFTIIFFMFYVYVVR